MINDEEIVPLYDPPHLLKCLRNNFLNKDIEIDFDVPNLREEDRKIASWKHIVTAYEIDVYSGFIERNLDLKEQHIYPDKRNKMKVKLMMQVFSRKMGRFVEVLAKSNGKILRFIYFIQLQLKKGLIWSRFPTFLLHYYICK